MSEAIEIEDGRWLVPNSRGCCFIDVSGGRDLGFTWIEIGLLTSTSHAWPMPLRERLRQAWMNLKGQPIVTHEIYAKEEFTAFMDALTRAGAKAFGG